MSTLVNFQGNNDFCPKRSRFANPVDSGLVLSLGPHVDLYCPPRKRSRIIAPFVLKTDVFEQSKKPSIDVLPDECLFEIFRRLPGAQEWSTCASVSKRWLMLLSSISRTLICTRKTLEILKTEGVFNLVKADVCSESETDVCSKLLQEPLSCSTDSELISGDKNLELENEGYLTRCLEGKKATDIRLAAIAVGTGSRGGLGKLTIRGSHSTCGVTNAGLSAIAHGCPSLRALSIWNVSSVGDEGLAEIAGNCHMLEKLDLCQCPSISDKGLIAIAKGCPNLTTLFIESCSNIGNGSLQAIGQHCSKLESLTIKDCRLVGDQGIATLLSLGQNTLMKIKLQDLNMTDVSLAVLGHYGKAVTDLVLANLQGVSEKGFWVMGSAHGLQKLKSFTVTCCRGLSDLGLEAVGKGCPNLKQLCLRKCSFVSDCGLLAFAKSAVSLESLQLEECNKISRIGVLASISNCGAKLKALSLVKCFGIKDDVLEPTIVSPCTSMRSLTIRYCPGFGSKSMAMVGRLCPQLQYIDLSGLHQITDAGLLPLVENCEAGLVKVNLSGCLNLTDAVVSTIAGLHGETLRVLNLDGCRNVTDGSLVAIALNCSVLNDLDMSKSGITDFGIAALSSAKQLSLEILSISGCPCLSDRSLPYLGNLGATLAGLNIQHCNSISSSAVDLLIQRLWRCDVLS